MSDLLGEPDDATPLEPEERDGLLQTWITYRSELNEAEQANIAAGAVWAWAAQCAPHLPAASRKTQAPAPTANK